MSNATLKFYRNRIGGYVASSISHPDYEAYIERGADGGWAWESLLFKRSQSEGKARTLNEARDAVRLDFAVIKDLIS